MKYQTTRKALLTALDALTRIIPARSTSNPALTHLLATPGGTGLEFSGTGLEFSGTNLEVDLRMPVPAEGGLMGTPRPFALPAHLFHQTVKRLAGELVELELEGNTLHVRSAGNTTKVQLADPETLGVMHFQAYGDGARIDGPVLAGALRNVLYAHANNAFQNVFRGVLVRITPQGIIVVTSDGYRVATHAPAGVVEALEARDLIIPGRNIEELARLLEAGPSELHFGDGLLSVARQDGAALNVKLLDGDFPDYERVIPKSIVLTVQVSGTQLLEALDRVSLYADTNANNRTELRISEGKLRLHAEGDYGTAEDVIDAAVSGPEEALRIAVNAAFTAQAIKQMLPGDVRIEFSGSASPMKFLSAGNAAPMAVVVALAP